QIGVSGRSSARVFPLRRAVAQAGCGKDVCCRVIIEIAETKNPRGFRVRPQSNELIDSVEQVNPIIFTIRFAGEKNVRKRVAVEITEINAKGARRRIHERDELISRLREVNPSAPGTEKSVGGGSSVEKSELGRARVEVESRERQ